jgi:hypothetical protein
MALRARRVAERMLHASELYLESTGRVVDDIHSGEEQDASAAVDPFADVTRDAAESLCVPPMVSAEIERHR